MRFILVHMFDKLRAERHDPQTESQLVLNLKAQERTFNIIFAV